MTSQDHHALLEAHNDDMRERDEAHEIAQRILNAADNGFTHYDHIVLARQFLRQDAAYVTAERDSLSWKEQFHSAASAASTYAEFYEAHHADFDPAGNYIPNSQLDGDVWAWRDQAAHWEKRWHDTNAELTRMRAQAVEQKRRADRAEAERDRSYAALAHGVWTFAEPPNNDAAVRWAREYQDVIDRVTARKRPASPLKMIADDMRAGTARFVGPERAS